MTLKNSLFLQNRKTIEKFQIFDLTELSGALDDPGFDGNTSLVKMDSQRKCEKKIMLISGYRIQTFIHGRKKCKLPH